ncbi:MAG: hypothetical protein KDE20_04350 [Caldilineaceae bacterium]|nr:hypothetical protein [Caldilineaceae bacterium]
MLSTHWDREWYQSFQNYRYQLVRLLDQVIEGFENGRLRGPFQTDGQAIILEDYLEIRPGRRDQLQRLAQEGKLVIGPWYVLPDEFLVSGESLVRNIRLGREIARSFGVEPSQAGFVCDLFGHNSQMPQIFAGFGIQGGFLWRGLNQTQTRHVRWRGADTTELACYRFPHGGYCDYTFQVRHAREHARTNTTDQVKADLQRYLEYEAEHTEVDPILLFDGGDHEEWDQTTYTAMVEYMEASSDFEIVHTSLDGYLDEMLPQAARINTVVHGELREPGIFQEDQQWVIPGVLSSRVWIKQANAECQALLCQWAEPTATWATQALSVEYPQGFLDVAWKWLLKNHPHDSICGCSIDVVHEDMKFRFSQCRQIADRLTTEALRSLAASVEGEIGGDELRVVVFNPLSMLLDEPVDLILQIPVEWPQFNEFFGFEPKPAFRIYGPDGIELPYQRLSQHKNRIKKRIYTTKFPETYRTNDTGVTLQLQIPASGYTTLTVRAEEGGRPTRHPTTPGLATSERSMANQYLAVTIETNGSLTLTDRRTGQTYSRLLTFEDCADIGDGWYHGQAVNDQTFVSTAGSAAVALVHDGPYLTTFRIRTAMTVPATFNFGDRMARSEELVSLTMDSFVSLRLNTDRVEIRSTVYNIAEDHRLRVLFPTGAQTETYLADTPFDVVERPIALASDNHRYRELEIETKPQQSWSAVFDHERGLAVIADGLLESAVRNQAERTLALTLFRSTRRTVMTDGEPNGLLPGSMTFRYWIMPLAGDVDRPRLCRLGQQLAAGIRDVQLRREDMQLHRKSTELQRTNSFLAVAGRVAVTSTRQVGDGAEVRLFNPTEKEADATLTAGHGRGWASVRRVDLESKPIGDVLASNVSAVTVAVAPKQIVTLHLTQG